MKKAYTSVIYPLNKQKLMMKETQTRENKVHSRFHGHGNIGVASFHPCIFERAGPAHWVQSKLDKYQPLLYRVHASINKLIKSYLETLDFSSRIYSLHLTPLIKQENSLIIYFFNVRVCFTGR